MSKSIQIWKPVSFSSAWENADISKLEDILPSWYSKRKELKEGNSDYEEFLGRLKRQHAIETGVVEKLYDLSEGITQTFIKEGFVEVYVQHDDTNISPKKLMSYLRDHFDAIDYIFDLVKTERPLTISFIKGLHQLVTKSQDTTDAIDHLGREVVTKLLKGEFKKQPNNPRRKDGTEYLYCPPMNVDMEMDNLISIYREKAEQGINAVRLSAWFHHAFTIIHPFQDGNGRMARLLASLILIKGGLFPLTIKRDEKAIYIDALEKADKGDPRELVALFGAIQKKSIEGILNFKGSSIPSSNSLKEAAKTLTMKLEEWQSLQRQKREKVLAESRKAVFELIYSLVGNARKNIIEVLPGNIRVNLESVLPTDRKHTYYTRQIIDYAKSNEYFFNRSLPRGWFKFNFIISEDRIYDLIVSVHHYSYDDSVLAIGGFMEYRGESNLEEGETTTPIDLPPYTISLEGDINKLRQNIEGYINDVLTIMISNIATEFN